MGCCEPVHQRKGEIDYKQLFDKKSDKEFQSFFDSYFMQGESSISQVDSYVKIGNQTCLPLAYALENNLPKKFRLLHSTYGASLAEMEKYFRHKGNSGIMILCENNYVELLQYYLPFYLKQRPSFDIHASYTIDFSTTSVHEHQPVFTPIQMACRRQHYGVLSFILGYFKEQLPPKELDVNFQEEFEGDNCVFLAAKAGDLNMLKFLHHHNARFDVYNKRGETVLQAAAVFSKRRPSVNYLPIFKFLIESAGVSPVENWEEILLVLQNGMLVHYFEQLLEEHGIMAKKASLEHQERIVVPFQRLETPSTIEMMNQVRFNRADMPKDTTYSVVSSIEDTYNRGTPFVSVLDHEDHT